MGTAADTFTDEARAAAGEAWLNASSWAIGPDGQSHEARAALEARVLAADAFVHAQDLPETDVLIAADYAAHEAGFAAAVAQTGWQRNPPSTTSTPPAPTPRTHEP